MNYGQYLDFVHGRSARIKDISRKDGLTSNDICNDCKKNIEIRWKINNVGVLLLLVEMQTTLFNPSLMSIIEVQYYFIRTKLSGFILDTQSIQHHINLLTPLNERLTVLLYFGMNFRKRVIILRIDATESLTVTSTKNIFFMPLATRVCSDTFLHVHKSTKQGMAIDIT